MLKIQIISDYSHGENGYRKSVASIILVPEQIGQKSIIPFYRLVIDVRKGTCSSCKVPKDGIESNCRNGN